MLTVQAAIGLFRNALGDLRSIWVALAATDLLYKLVAVGLLTPFASGVASLSLWLGGSSVLADQDILLFALNPLGLIGLVTMMTVSLAVVALEQACLITVGITAAEGTPVSQMTAVRHALSRSLDVVGLTAQLTGRVSIMAAPFLIGIGVVYFVLLTEFDINYYLTEQPWELWVAVGTVSVLLTGLTAVLGPRLIGWGLSLPLVVLEGQSASGALTLSRQRTEGHRPLMALVLVGWAITSVLLSSSALGAVALLGRAVAPVGQGSLTVALALMLGVVVLWIVTSYLVTFAQGASFALLVSQLYKAIGRSANARTVSDVVAAGGRARERGPLAIRRSMVIGGFAVAGVATAVLVVGALQALDVERGVSVIAHRGASLSAPENTLAAVDQAIADQADYVEIDVQLSADGEVVVVHDSDLMKTAGVRFRIGGTSFSELRSVDIGRWFAAEFDDQRVPSLDEVLDLCRGHATVMVELKYYGPNENLAPRVIETVEAAGMADEVVIMSLDGGAVEQVRSLRPDWTVGLLAATAVGDLTTVDADYLAVSTGLATQTLVRRAHARGQDVYVWTVNDPVQMVRMMSLGVDGIITDVPATARTVLNEAADMNPAERLLIALSFFFGAAAPDPPIEDDLGVGI